MDKDMGAGAALVAVPEEVRPRRAGRRRAVIAEKRAAITTRRARTAARRTVSTARRVTPAGRRETRGRADGVAAVDGEDHTRAPPGPVSRRVRRRVDVLIRIAIRAGKDQTRRRAPRDRMRRPTLRPEAPRARREARKMAFPSIAG